MTLPMFVKKGNDIVIKVYVYEDEGAIAATHEEKDIPDGVTPEVVSFTFRKPNYADSNLILRHFQNIDPTGTNPNVDAVALQEIVMTNQLYKWDIKDENGNTVSLNKTNIENLEPAIGRAAAFGYIGKIKF